MLEVTISGSQGRPSILWVDVHHFLCQLTGRAVVMTKIAREDGGIDYAAEGAYRVGYAWRDETGQRHLREARFVAA